MLMALVLSASRGTVSSALLALRSVLRGAHCVCVFAFPHRCALEGAVGDMLIGDHIFVHAFVNGARCACKAVSMLPQ